MKRTALGQAARCLGLSFVLTVSAPACSGTSTRAVRTTGTSSPRFATSGVAPVSGFAARQDPAVAWTGRNLFVFGGYRSVGATSDGRDLLRDGAVIDVESGNADGVPSAPFAGPLLSPAAARSGDSVVVAGIECSDYRAEQDSDAYSCAKDSGRFALATFDPVARRWSTVARLPSLDALRSTPTWARGRTDPGFWISQVLGTESGQTMIAATYGNANEFWVHPPGTATLTQLPDPSGASDACVAGTRVVVMTAHAASGPGTEASLRVLDLAEPDATWSDTSTTALGVGFAPQLACLGTRVMLTNRYGIAGNDGRIFDLAAQTWNDVAAPPPNQVTSADGRTFFPPFYSSSEQRLWTGAELLELTDFANPVSSTLPPGRAYNPATNSWRPLPPLPTRLALPQWAGSAVVGYTTDGARHVAVHYLPT